MTFSGPGLSLSTCLTRVLSVFQKVDFFLFPFFGRGEGGEEGRCACVGGRGRRACVGEGRDGRVSVWVWGSVGG